MGVTERRAGYQFLESFLTQAKQCKEEMSGNFNIAQNAPCSEVKPMLEWQVNQRVNNERMWEMDQKIKDMEQSLQDAILEAEKAHPPAAAGPDTVEARRWR